MLNLGLADPEGLRPCRNLARTGHRHLAQAVQMAEPFTLETVVGYVYFGAPGDYVLVSHKDRRIVRPAVFESQWEFIDG